MLFNSFNFVLYFLPLTVVGYYILARFLKPTATLVWLLVVSMFFYSCFGLKVFAFILASSIINFGFSKVLVKRNRVLYIISIVFNVSLLLFIKLPPLLKFEDWIVPIGISYLSFREIGYLTDIYKEKIKPEGVLNYFLFVFFFPHIIEGPITRARDFFKEIKDEKRVVFSEENMSFGIYLFAVGMLKKVLLADNLGKLVSYGFSNQTNISVTETVIVMFSYALQLYFDFSGYSDMAVGIGRMFNISLPVNFFSPYKSLSVGEIWQRWHITLTDFLKEYIYIPLGGNRKGTVRTYLNILLVYLISGLWHGIGLTFVIWGLLHGLMQCVERMCKGFFEKIWKTVRLLFTFVFWVVTFFLFRSPTLTEFWYLFSGLFTKKTFFVSGDFLNAVSFPEITLVSDHLGTFGSWIELLEAPALLLISFIIIWGFKNPYEKEFTPKLLTSVLLCIGFVWCILSLGTQTTFVYEYF